ncbi:hypothetical protein ACFL21_00050 [Patescibacteria group bacterium]
MADLSAKMLKQREKLHIRAYILMCVVVLILMAFFTITKWGEYSITKEAVEKNLDFIEVLKTKVSDEKANYDSNKGTFDDLAKTIEKKLDDIFPEADKYTSLVMQLDSFEDRLNTRSDPFEVSSIDFQEPVEGEISSILPLTMNIRSSSENFQKFLHMVENSGALDNQIRLMDIQSIRLSFEQRDEGSNMINFSVQINAYFQKLR